MFRRTALSALLLSTALVGPALAEPMQPEGWQTGVMRKPDGEFAYCVSESKFSNNLWVIMALNPTGDINLGVGQRGANLPVGQDKPVRLVIDNQPVRELSARAAKPELMVINAGQNPSFLDALASGSVLKVDTMEFSLKGSGEAVATLRECVHNSTGTATANPPVAATTAPATAETSAPTQQVAQAPQAAPAPTEPAQPAASAPATTPVPEAKAEPAPVKTAANDIKWNQPRIAVAPPGWREENTLPPSMQQEQAAQAAAQAATLAPAATPAPAPVEAAAASPAPQSAAPTPAPATAEAAPAQAAMAPELTPPAPDRTIVGYPAGTPNPAQTAAPAAAPAVPAAPAPEPAQAAAPVIQTAPMPVGPEVTAKPEMKLLPAQLERLLTAANIRDLETAPVTSSDIAYAWKSRDMLGNVREIAVPPGTNIVQLAGQHYSLLKRQCGGEFTASLGSPEPAGALQLLKGSTVCRSNGKSIYTTLVFALSRQGVLSIVSHQIDQGRRAAPDRAQSGLIEALKATQG